MKTKRIELKSHTFFPSQNEKENKINKVHTNEMRTSSPIPITLKTISIAILFSSFARARAQLCHSDCNFTISFNFSYSRCRSFIRTAHTYTHTQFSSFGFHIVSILLFQFTFFRCLLTHFVNVFFWIASRSSVTNPIATASHEHEHKDERKEEEYFI